MSPTAEAAGISQERISMALAQHSRIFGDDGLARGEGCAGELTGLMDAVPFAARRLGNLTTENKIRTKDQII